MGDDILAARQPPKARSLEEANAQVAELDHVIRMLLQFLRQKGIVFPEALDELGRELELVQDILFEGHSANEPLASTSTKTAKSLYDAIVDGDLWSESMSIDELIRLIRSTLPFPPGVTIKVKNLSYIARRNAQLPGMDTVGTKVLRVVKALTILPLLKSYMTKPKYVTKKVLRDVSIILPPGELTLVLGPPGCGKTSLLRAIRDDLPIDSNHTMAGEVLYNDQSAKSGAFVLPKVAAYVPQTDFHTAHMTVTETLEFAFDCMEGGKHVGWLEEPEMTDEMRRILAAMDEKKTKVRCLTKILGLNNAKDTIIGNDLIRGISGGEKRRVSCGEMLVGSASVLLLDSISNGLDSSTTQDILSALSKVAPAFNKTVAVSLLQPPPQTFDLFQRVVLMADGYVIFSGPTSTVRLYFESLGFYLPENKDVADWLAELPTQQGSQYMISSHDPPPPRTASAFAMTWEQSELAKEQMAELDAKLQVVPEWMPNHKVRFAGSWYFYLSVCLKKGLALRKRDTSYTKARLGQCLVMSLIIGSIFFQLDPYNYTSVMGVLFFSLLFLTLGAMAELPESFLNRSVFYKQFYQAFYPVLPKILAETAVASVQTAIEVVCFVPAVYFLAGFNYAVGSFLIFLIIFIGLNLSMNSIYKMFGALFQTFDAAQGFGGIVLLLLGIFAGYLFPESMIPHVLIFIYWLSPLSWAFRAATINEFSSSSYDVCSVPNVPESDPCPSGITIADEVFTVYDIRTGNAWMWGGIAYLYGFWFLMTALNAMLLSQLRFHAVADVDGDEEETQEDANGSVGSTKRLLESLTLKAPPASPRNHDSSLKSPTADVEAPVFSPVVRNSTIGRRYHTSANADRVSIASKASSGAGDAQVAIPVTLTFENIRYSVPHPGGDGMLELLQDVTGYAMPGTMTCLMGSSGAGKTTLLDVLAGRKTTGAISGTIKLNGHEKDEASFGRIAAYIEQFDAHSPSVTVEEAVQFSALMRLEETEWTPESRKAHVKHILEVLELTPIAKQVIGNDISGGISMEQRKRTTIAVEMAANPSILFLDEPTTGLDARSAQVVMRAVRTVADMQRTIICTIHQPSSYIFEMFDSLLLLKKGGRTTFFGELGPDSQSMISFFMTVPGCMPISENANAATWALEQIGAGTTSTVNSDLFANFYSASALKNEQGKLLATLSAPDPGRPPITFPRKYAASTATQYKGNLTRACLQYWRSPNYNVLRTMVASLQAVVLSCSYGGKTIENVGDAMGLIGIVFLAATMMGLLFYLSSIPFYSAERLVFYREQASQMYSVGPYATGYFLAEIPYLLISTLTFVSIFYFIAGLDHRADKFFFFYLVYTLYISFMCFMGHAMTALMPTAKQAQSFGAVLNSIFCVFAGFLITPSTIPVYWEWAYHLDPQRYVVEGLIMFQFHDQTTPILLADGSYIPLNDWVYDFFGGAYTVDNMWYDVMALILFIVGIRVVYIYAVYSIRHISR